jgi:ATP-dependent DNA helicase UvrD/PcrA
VQRLVAQNAMDFDDLLLHPLTLFEQHPDRLAAYQDRFRAILVDEFQDTNRAQYLLVHHLSAQHRDLCVVGDDDQSIYSWRGADLRNMLDFQKDYPDATVYRLEENYRSTQMILDAANGVIEENSQRLGKTLFTGRGPGEPVVVVTTADDRDESEWIAKEILDRSSSDHYAFGDIAVLYRTNAQSRSVEDALRRSNVPFRVVGAVSFYARREIKDLLSYLRLLVNPTDDEAFLRAIQVPRRGLGVASINTLRAFAQQWQRSQLDTATIADRITELRPQAKKAFLEFADLIYRLSGELADSQPAALIERVMAEIDYERVLNAEGPEGADRIENVRELISSAAEWTELSEDAESSEAGTPLERFLANAALTTSLDESSAQEGGVTLMTVHTAKGLEWPVVIVSGLEDGLFPLSRSLDTQEATEEERRLAYVAITRAQDRLYLTWAKARRRDGQRVPQKASRFLTALPPGVVEARFTSSGKTGFGYRVSGGHAMLGHALASPGLGAVGAEFESQDAPRYIKGERVRHKTFGSGTIRGLSGVGRNLKVIVHFDEEEAGTKELLVTHAGLERDWGPA